MLSVFLRKYYWVMCNVLFDEILHGRFFSLISFGILFLLLHLKLSVLGEVQGKFLHGRGC